MEQHVYGGKYDKELPTAEIAKRFRADVKAAQKRGELPNAKISVRTRSYARAEIIIVQIKETPFPVINERFLRGIVSDEYQITEEAAALQENLECMLKEYNCTYVDSLSDYYYTNFFCEVGYDPDLANRELDAFTKQMEAERVADVTPLRRFEGYQSPSSRSA